MTLLGIQSKTGKTSRIRAYVADQLEEAGMVVRARGSQIFAVKGDEDALRPYVVAHSDTVHSIVPSDNYAVGMYTDRGDVVYHAFDPETNGLRGVGGDDKCGMWVAIEAARSLQNVGVIITVDEEIGCKGARRVARGDLEKATVLLQSDRRGNSDAVWKGWGGSELSSIAWRDHVNHDILLHGYEWNQWGAGTDVIAMLETGASPVSTINISSGYYDPHSYQERVSEEDCENALELIISLAQKSGGEQWVHELPRRTIARPIRDRSEGVSRYGGLWDEATWDNALQAMVTKDGWQAKFSHGIDDFLWKRVGSGGPYMTSAQVQAIRESQALQKAHEQELRCIFPNCIKYGVKLSKTKLWYCEEHYDFITGKEGSERVIVGSDRPLRERVKIRS